MVNEYIESWTKKHGKRHCDYILSRMNVTQLDKVEDLARNIVFDGKKIKNIKLKQDYLSLSIFTLFSGMIVSFLSLFMPVFFENGSTAGSLFGALTIFISSVINCGTLVNIRKLEMSEHSKRDRQASSTQEHEVNVEHTGRSSTSGSYTEKDVETSRSRNIFKIQMLSRN